jgi:hypothetical protein
MSILKTLIFQSISIGSLSSSSAFAQRPRLQIKYYFFLKFEKHHNIVALPLLGQLIIELIS